MKLTNINVPTKFKEVQYCQLHDPANTLIPLHRIPSLRATGGSLTSAGRLIYGLWGNPKAQVCNTCALVWILVQVSESPLLVPSFKLL